MIRKAVVLAAGQGLRIRTSEIDLPKPLHVVAGLTLLKRTILTLARAGVTSVHVVIGFMGDQIRRAIEGDPAYASAGVTVELIDNPDFAKSNGVSVLQVAGHVDGPFLLSMSDHVYDPSIAAAAAGADMDAADLYLCVDRRIDEVYDIDDATKVKTSEGKIVDIGKTIPDYDCIDCGVFAVGPALLDALRAVHAERGDCSLSDGVRRLAEVGRARVIDVGTAFWQDVDTEGARLRAEDQLIARLRKPTDGPVARIVNRRISLSLTRLLLRTSITPNQMTVVANVIGAIGIWLVFRATWASVAIGAVLVQVQSILDGCDGEIARLKFQGSRFGEWLDYVLDNVVNAGYGLALGFASASLLGQPLFRWLGIGACLGFVAYDLMVYAQLAGVRHAGDHMAFRWWHQKEGEAHVIVRHSQSPGSPAAVLHALTRRDVFLAAFMVLAIARLPQVAALWYAILAAGHVVLTVLHLANGGIRSGRTVRARAR